MQISDEKSYWCGPISKHSITFYVTQTDICGPFKAYSLHHKRTRIKILLIVYCCISTSTTNIKVMDDYSVQAFIQTFIRFSCEVGYPNFTGQKKLGTCS